MSTSSMGPPPEKEPKPTEWKRDMGDERQCATFHFERGVRREEEWEEKIEEKEINIANYKKFIKKYLKTTVRKDNTSNPDLKDSLARKQYEELLRQRRELRAERKKLEDQHDLEAGRHEKLFLKFYPRGQYRSHIFPPEAA
ncbi:uncharacterized protein KY384_005647 [Bacidia gigantensis]|uniref:uncharacterized protein n=1 Tax=Bacidia gigantensis TaxID=2732470 RepID=UPI001D049980|nr:uncharacterized protein KY384_005647 [Bacidia gigantensis]KAG8530164.1 hypothetical protein KY384_005647 [Bacidia gigantensis]